MSRRRSYSQPLPETQPFLHQTEETTRDLPPPPSESDFLDPPNPSETRRVRIIYFQTEWQYPSSIYTWTDETRNTENIINSYHTSDNANANNNGSPAINCMSSLVGSIPLEDASLYVGPSGMSLSLLREPEYLGAFGKYRHRLPPGYDINKWTKISRPLTNYRFCSITQESIGRKEGYVSCRNPEDDHPIGCNALFTPGALQEWFNKYCESRNENNLTCPGCRRSWTNSTILINDHYRYEMNKKLGFSSFNFRLVPLRKETYLTKPQKYEFNKKLQPKIKSYR